ncbi:hypothetical protein MPER_05841 [Moniliophthora perniciosa FA553]|nr:hypothetical protein MPER_05841 [Moniliophthora perniciosa FA553]
MVSDRDHAFFIHLITYYISKHSVDILEELSEFTPPIPWDPSAESGDNEFELELKRNAHNTGLVVLDFCNVDEPDISLDCLSVRHISDVIKDKRISGRRIAERLEVEHMWIVGDGGTRMHVLAFFPATIGGGDFVYPVSEVYNLPELSEPGSDDDEGWTTDDSFEDDSEDDS